MKRKIYPSSIGKYGDDIYILDSRGNGLFRLNLDDNSVGCVTQFNSEPSIAHDLFTDIIVHEDTIFAVPHMATSIGIFDAKSNCCDYVKLPEELVKIKGVFKTAVYCNGELYLLGYCTNNVWCYSEESRLFTEIKIPNSKGVFISAFLDGNKIVLVSRISTYVWTIDCISKEVSYFETDCDEGGFVDIQKIRGRYYFVTKKTYSLWGMLENKKIVEGYEKNITEGIWPYGGSVVVDDSIYINSNTYMGINFIRLDDTRTYKKVEIPIEACLSMGKPLACCNILYTFIAGTPYICVHSMSDNCIKVIELTAENDAKREFVDGIGDKLIQESNGWALDEFIQLIL